jgi:hypothetical protein
MHTAHTLVLMLHVECVFVRAWMHVRRTHAMACTRAHTRRHTVFRLLVSSSSDSITPVHDTASSAQSPSDSFGPHAVRSRKSKTGVGRCLTAKAAGCKP